VAAESKVPNTATVGNNSTKASVACITLMLCAQLASAAHAKEVAPSDDDFDTSSACSNAPRIFPAALNKSTNSVWSLPE
jgi:hypothetical protein